MQITGIDVTRYGGDVEGAYIGEVLIVVVRTDHDLGVLAAHLLEARAEDGLVTWNVLDDELEVGGEYPILRLLVADTPWLEGPR